MARHKKSGERLNLIRRKVQLGATKQDQEFLAAISSTLSRCPLAKALI
jgi:hypothetical protein